MNEFLGKKIIGYYDHDDRAELPFKNLSRTDWHLVLCFEDGSYLAFYHDPQCCENTWLETEDDEIQGLIDQEIVILYAGMHTYTKEYSDGSETTATFYHLRTKRSDHCLRFGGSSNGYYSTYVDIAYYGADFKRKPIALLDFPEMPTEIN